MEYEQASSPQTDSKGQPAARAAIDGVTDATKPGDDLKVSHEKGGPQLGSGNAPLGETLHDLMSLTVKGMTAQMATSLVT